MSKLVTSDNLKAYHSELAEHLQLLERDKAYLVGDTVKYDGLTLKCTIAGDTDTDKVDYSLVDVGDTIVDGTATFTVIDPNSMWYEEDKFYMLDDIVVYNDKFYKCTTAHTATSTFDTTKWSEISAGSSGGGGISTYTTGTSYSAGDVVIKDQALYQANTTTSTTWVDSEWNIIGTSFNTTSTYAQKIVTNVVAPYEMLLQVGDSNYCKPPIDVLKKTGGSSNTTLTLENYNNASAYTGTSDFLKIENSKAKLYNYKEYPITPQTLSTIDIGVSDEVDFSDFVGSSNGGIDSNTLVMLHFNDLITDSIGSIPDSSFSTMGNILYDDGKFDKCLSNGGIRCTDTTNMYQFGDVDFTIDFWTETDSNDYGSAWTCFLNTVNKPSTGNFKLGICKNFVLINGIEYATGITTVDDLWHHIAFVRHNNNYYYYFDGSLIISGSISGSIGNYAAWDINYDKYSNTTINCGIDEFRFSNVARWTSNFTPPTEPYARPNYNISSLEVN